MIQWGVRSQRVITELHPELQRLFLAVARRMPARFDIGLICGHRGETEQNLAHANGKSEKRWPDSEHNTKPSRAVDFLPVHGSWADELMFCVCYGYIQCCADDMHIPIRWLGDGNMNGKTTDQRLRDLGHIELL